METTLGIIGVIGTVLFKSYYVVWKLVAEIFIVIVDILFKSYYVVWKPDVPGNLKITDIGLNRTM